MAMTRSPSRMYSLLSTGFCACSACARVNAMGSAGASAPRCRGRFRRKVDFISSSERRAARDQTKDVVRPAALRR